MIVLVVSLPTVHGVGSLFILVMELSIRFRVTMGRCLFIESVRRASNAPQSTCDRIKMTKLPTTIDVLAEWAKQNNLHYEDKPVIDYMGSTRVLVFYASLPHNTATWVSSINEFGMIWFSSWAHLEKLHEHLNISLKYMGHEVKAPLHDPKFLENLRNVLNLASERF